MNADKNLWKSRLPKLARALREADPYFADESARYAQPLPSRAYLCEILARQGAPMLPEALMAMFAIQPDEVELFDRRLRAMVRDGQIKVDAAGALHVAQPIVPVTGRVVGHPEGFGFVVPDEGGEDLFLPPREMQSVFHGDRVCVSPLGRDRRGRLEARLVSVTARAWTKLVGRLRHLAGEWVVVPEERRIRQQIVLEADHPELPEPESVVVVTLTRQPERDAPPRGRIVEVLGRYADPGMEIEIALRKHDLPHVFSAAAEAQAADTPQRVRKKDWKTPEGLKREDLRQLPFVTIDGETARDFDDAVYAQREGRGWRLWVAIADVSHYVRPGDALDATAFERGTSVYFPRRVIPMLPEALSSGICSLNPDVDRLAMVCEMRISARGRIKDYRFYPAVIHSHARFTYTQVWAMLSQPAPQKASTKCLGDLKTLHALYKALLAARSRRGAIDFDTVETQMIFDDRGKIARIEPVVRNDAHRLIEECMLAANVCAAEFLAQHAHPILYRVHEGPNARKLDALQRFLAARGLRLGGDASPTTGDYADLVATVRERPDAGLIQTMLLRSMQQAVYRPELEGHFGLAYEAYTHFTSPIRRYPDLLVHRAIKAVLAGKRYRPAWFDELVPGTPRPKGAARWVSIGQRCSMTERRADEASREVNNWLKCYYMQDHLGACFDGTISAVTSFGAFVMLDGVYIEGLLHVSALGEDYFRYDDASHRLVGERTGLSYGLTERVRVQVARVDLEQVRVELVLAPTVPLSAPEKSGAHSSTPRSKNNHRTKASDPSSTDPNSKS